MVSGPFELARLPAVVFGEGSVTRLPELAARYGRRALLVTGRSSLRSSRHWPSLEDGLQRHGIRWEVTSVEGEPSPTLVDDAVRQHHRSNVEVVIGIGGGSALDAGKAIAGLLRPANSVLDHLEGVGRGLPYRGPALPFIAAPTTAGTGSEATKNAVLSSRGSDGYKKSFRHEMLVARYAVIDPALLETCPPQLVAADGMDALTQLIESYVSPRANRFTEALAESGLVAVRAGLLPWYENRGDAAAARSNMAYAAWLSGVVLAQTGLGVVHGLASPLGAFSPAAHGAVCGCLVAAATGVNVSALARRQPEHPARRKYARIAEILGERRAADADFLVGLLADWTDRLRLPRLGDFGIAEADLGRIVSHSRGSSMKTNPIVLEDEEITQILRTRL